MADETPVTPAPPTSDSIPITDPTASQSIPIDLNPEYDPAKDTRAPFLKVNPNPTGPTVEAAPKPSVLERAKKVVTEGIPRYSTRTTANPKYGQEQFLAPDEAMTPEEQRQAPVAAGALEAAGGLTSPATISTVAATAGLGEAPAIVSKVASALFAGQIATSVYEQYPALKAAVDKAQHAKSKEEHDDAFADAQRLMTHMGADTLMGLLAAKHGVEGAKSILDATTGSGVPDQASTFKSPGKAPAAIEPEETHPEMNRQTVKDLQNLGYSNQHITNFDIGEIRDILKNQTPAAEHPVSKTAAPAGPDPEALEAEGGKLVSHQPAVSTSAETPATAETGAAVEKPVEGVEKPSKVTDPVEEFVMSDKIQGKKVRGATPKTTDAEAPAPDALAEHDGKFVGTTPEPAAPAYHPDLQKLVDHFGETDDASKLTNGASFITPSGKFVHLAGGTTHDSAIDWATGSQQISGDNRPDFLKNTGAVRTRFMLDAKAGKTMHISVPEQGATAEQIPAIQQAIAKAGRNGNVVMERADVTPETKDQLTMTKAFPKASETEDYLRQIQAHPDQKDIVQSEKQNPHKDTYGMQITDADGTVHIEKVDAHTNNDAVKIARKKFPDAGIQRIPDQDEAHIPSTKYEVPTGKRIKMPASYGISEDHTEQHEMAHGLIALQEGLETGGMLSSHHPIVTSDTRAAHLLVRIPRGPAGNIRTDKALSVAKSTLAGIAQDEINGVPRSANHNLPLNAEGDGTSAYNILKAAGYTHEDAIAKMHELIDQNVVDLSHPAMASVIQENTGFREKGLSRQFHHSPERLQNMNAEVERRKTNGKETGISNTTPTREGDGESNPADVARGEGETAGANQRQSDEEEGIVSEEKIQKGMTPELAQQIADAHEANGGSTFNLTHGNMAGTDNYSVSIHPDRGQVLQTAPTAPSRVSKATPKQQAKNDASVAKLVEALRGLNKPGPGKN